MRIKLVFSLALFAGFLASCVLILPPGENLDIGVISGSVWLDSDGDGLRDAGESGLPEVRVQLLSDNEKVYIDKGTNSRGEFLFGRLDVEDDFYIRVILPNEYEFTQAGGDSDVHVVDDESGLSDLLSELGDVQPVVDAGFVLKE